MKNSVIDPQTKAEMNLTKKHKALWVKKGLMTQKEADELPEILFDCLIKPELKKPFDRLNSYEIEKYLKAKQLSLDIRYCG